MIIGHIVVALCVSIKPCRKEPNVKGRQNEVYIEHVAGGHHDTDVPVHVKRVKVHCIYWVIVQGTP